MDRAASPRSRAPDTRQPATHVTLNRARNALGGSAVQDAAAVFGSA